MEEQLDRVAARVTSAGVHDTSLQPSLGEAGASRPEPSYSADTAFTPDVQSMHVNSSPDGSCASADRLKQASCTAHDHGELMKLATRERTYAWKDPSSTLVAGATQDGLTLLRAIG
ncbi:DUF4639 domain-containing protein, partial [Ornithinimicrobium cerasi]|uniref:DUF4639 domain-containing protein n=1 Tax=Ornithinimicrobium cerasi TaxID=2248773 RepID=UPI001F1C0A6F